MTSESKRKEVKALIDNIKKHSDQLAKSPTIPMLELSMILSKINRLHESTVILKYLVAKEQHHEEEEFGLDTLSIPSVMSNKDNKESISDLEKEIDQPAIIAEESSTDLEEGEEVIVEMEYEVDEEAETQDIESEQEHNEEKELTLSDQLEEGANVEEIINRLEEEEVISKPDLNEQYSESEDTSVSKQLQKQPITDLVSAIGLNERYLYANELFDGEIEVFKEELNQLNDFASLSEATNYFHNQLKNRFNWEDENELADALYNLVERRYL